MLAGVAARSLSKLSAVEPTLTAALLLPGRRLLAARADVGSGEEPRDAEGSLAQGDMIVKAPPPHMQMHDPADPAHASILEKVQDLFRPSSTTGHAYHYAEDSARAVVQEQQSIGADKPGVESMYAPIEAVGDEITAPRSWHFSDRSDQLDEQQQQELAEDAKNKEKSRS